MTNRLTLTSLRQDLVLFCLVLCLGCGFAMYTHHAWEDWYITYRASKNLATGHGLVFNPGEVLHTFTSPLNALVPAALNYLTGNRSDDLVLWLYRIISIICLGGAVVLLRRTLVNLQLGKACAVFAVALLLLDVKTIDFTINGQETSFVLLALAASLYILLRPGNTSWRWLGVSWGALLWSRPDGCIEIAASAFAVWLFAPELTSAANRKQLLLLYARAGAVMLAIYSPWLLWTTYYYGTPVPHTIIAKGAFVHIHVLDLLKKFAVFPFSSLSHEALGGSLAPVDYFFGGWPAGMVWYFRVIEWCCCFAWLVPGVWPRTRVFSFVFMTGIFYLLDIAVPYAWYYPQVTLFGVVTLAAVIAQLFQSKAVVEAPAFQRHFLLALPLAIQALVFGAASYQLKLHQSLIEDSIRKPIGLWLHDQARPGDTLFVECLGYIGFYSQMKTYDFPGMSSPEMVAARKAIGPVGDQRWDLLIRYLQPDWLVLRESEARRIREADPDLLRQRYLLVNYYSADEKIRQAGYIPGVDYLLFDSRFLVFRKSGT